MTTDISCLTGVWAPDSLSVWSDLCPWQDEAGLDHLVSRRIIVKFVRQTELYMKHDVTGKQDLIGLVTC